MFHFMFNVSSIIHNNFIKIINFNKIITAYFSKKFNFHHLYVIYDKGVIFNAASKYKYSFSSNIIYLVFLVFSSTKSTVTLKCYIIISIMN